MGDLSVVVSRLSMANDHWPTTGDYFCGTGPGGVAGFAGCDLAGAAFTPCSTEFEPLWRDAITESVIEVTIKMMADHVVALDRTEAAPRGPKAVWLPMPPKAAAISPLWALCSSTTMMRNKQTIMWTIVISMTMSLKFLERHFRRSSWFQAVFPGIVIRGNEHDGAGENWNHLLALITQNLVRFPSVGTKLPLPLPIYCTTRMRQNTNPRHP